jgi:hypothetical protein
MNTLQATNTLRTEANPADSVIKNGAAMKYFLCLFFTFLVACGGGGGGGGSSPEDGDNGQPNTPPPTTNGTPIAKAGDDQNVITGSFVSLNGSASSDPDGDQLTFQWTFLARPNGSNAILDSSVLESPGFTADQTGTYQLRLVVNDGEVSSAPDSVTIIASQNNRKPTANAGQDVEVIVGETVNLNGALSSDPDGDPLNYSWLLASKPASSSTSLSSNTSETPSIFIDVQGAYVIQLVVSDGQEDSQIDSLLITADSVPVSTGNLYLYGGFNHEVFLGCLTCGKFITDSVCNEFGTYGSEFQAESIWNQFGVYGSEFQQYSPWNEFSITGPGIYNENKSIFYGTFTINDFDASQTTNPTIKQVLDYFKQTEDHQDTRDYACE